MSTTVLNEHDANQGAQSKGEFLGMTGNCGWYLLGAAGATVMMVIVLWGVLGISLLLCILIGIVLCLLSVVYVFVLKNNKPEHFDTDFFESVLVEAGLIELSFGPRERRLQNPFASGVADQSSSDERNAGRQREPSAAPRVRSSAVVISPATMVRDEGWGAKTSRTVERTTEDQESTVSLGAYEKLQAELDIVQDELEAVLIEHEED